MVNLSNETVSVIVPVYNGGRYLAETLDSALLQSYSPVELVVVDDCSIDNTQQILEGYSARHSNIVWRKLPHNSGAAVARNCALQLAAGRYVAFLDSDDLWLPEKISAQLRLMRETGAAICFTAIEIIDENGGRIKPKRDIPEKVDYQFLLRNTAIATSSVLIDRMKTGLFEMPLIRSGQDYATWLQLLRNRAPAYGINEALVKYRRRGGSLSANKIESVLQVWTIQTQNEGVGGIRAATNSLFFAINAFKKHYL